MKLIIICIMFLIYPMTGWACSFNISPLNFAEYNPISNNDVPMSSNIRITGCLLTVLVGFKFNSGNSGSYSQRYMQHFENTDKLNYNLYLDSNRQTIWGDGTQGTSYYNSLITLSLGAYNVPIYGMLIKRQNVSAGSYSDNIQVTVSF